MAENDNSPNTTQDPQTDRWIPAAQIPLHCSPLHRIIRRIKSGIQAFPVRLPDPEYVRHSILMRYRPYSMRKKGFCVWGKMGHNNPFRVVYDYLEITLLIAASNIRKKRNARYCRAFAKKLQKEKT